MTTLVIHPDDRTTDFLKPIYENIKNLTVITGDLSRDDVIESIKLHDRVLMMGHGSPMGLFGYNFNRPYIIDSTCVDALKTKGQNVMYLWCHANKFVEYYSLQGFYSGMFISEVAEANICGISDATQEQVTLSNESFVDICRSCIKDLSSMFQFSHKVSTEYGLIADSNPIVEYNCSRLRFRT